jgi:hypothetical protein
MIDFSGNLLIQVSVEIQKRKTVENLYELVESTSFDIKYCALRAFVTLDENGELTSPCHVKAPHPAAEMTRKIVGSLLRSTSDSIRHRRAIRWLKDLEGSLAIVRLFLM